ncbi:hypothetical protein ACVKSY_000430 [Sphingomonas sp. PvP107]
MFGWLKSLFGPTTVREIECTKCQSWQTYTEVSYGNGEYWYKKCDRCGMDGNGEPRVREI